METKISRRDFTLTGLALLPVPPTTAVEPPATASKPPAAGGLQVKAREGNRRSYEAMRKRKLPLDLEPAFRFKA